ncbi:MAG TPA: AAA family ATPase, partial [Pyrinomonadaceae bacterium]|nr:AAA family ATPase [Pyrinomonadaceae bacterium]
MFLKSIDVQNFRNLKDGIDCSSGINILYGNNGHGKTNWLESIQLLAHARSFRTQKLYEAVV